MRRLVTAGVAIAATVAAMCGTGAAAAAAVPPAESGPVYYLSLGDSLAYGFQQAIFNAQVASGAFDPAAFVGYAGFLQPRLGVLVHGSAIEVNYGCPGETTTSFSTACVFTTVDGAPTSWLHNPYPTTTSQEAAALSFLAAHRGQVAAITLDLGSNDLRQALLACVATNCNLNTALPPVVSNVVTNLANILFSLEAADPGVPVALANIYNPEVVDPRLPASIRTLTDTLVAGVNASFASLVQTLDHLGLPVALADAYGAINGGIPGLPDTKSVCILTNMCTPLLDIHASTPGYVSLSRAFLQALETVYPGG